MSRCKCQRCGGSSNVHAYGYCTTCANLIDDPVEVGRSLAERGFGYTTTAYARSLMPTGSSCVSIARTMGWTCPGKHGVKLDTGRARARFFEGDSVSTHVLLDLMEALGIDTRDVGPLRERAKFYCQCGEPMRDFAAECGFCVEEARHSPDVLLCA